MATFSATMSLTASSLVAPSSLSSRSAFASPIVSVAPCKSARTGPMTVRASSAEEPKSARREMLATLLAAGAVLVSSGNASAAQGPGIGAQKTAKRADKLLKAGDALINNDSPPRFGPGRVGGSQQDASRFSQQAGSGAVEGLQGGADKTIQGAKSNLKKAQARIDGIFGKKTSNPLSGNPLEKAASNVKGGVDDLLQNGPGKIKSDVKTAGDKVSNDVASTTGLGNKAGNVVDQAQDNASNAVREGKGLLGGLKDKVTGAISQ